MKVYVLTYHYPDQRGDERDLAIIGAYRTFEAAIKAATQRANDVIDCNVECEVYADDDGVSVFVNDVECRYQVTATELS